MRDATPDDAPSLSRIQTEVWRTSYPNPALGITPAAIERKLKLLNDGGEERLRGILSSGRGHTWVASDGDTIVGFIGVRTSGDVNTIEALHIMLDHQGRGIGHRLIQQALAWLGTTKPIALNVVAYNERAIRLYESYGFMRRDCLPGEFVAVDDTVRIPLMCMLKA
jgi:ribosomal protein S18 acetylase RimI-like enzyme